MKTFQNTRSILRIVRKSSTKNRFDRNDVGNSTELTPTDDVTDDVNDDDDNNDVDDQR